MKNSGKARIAKFIAAVTAASLLAVSAPAGYVPLGISLVSTAGALTYGDYSYEVDSDGESVTITKYNGSDEDVVIPDSIDDMPVTAIGKRAFQDCGTLLSVTIPGSVETIGDYAFYQCVNMKTVTFNEGLKTIGNNAFIYCRAIETLTIPGSVTSIGNHAFQSCTGLVEVTTEPGTEDAVVGMYAFADCSSLTEVHFGQHIKEIKGYAFFNCEKLIRVFIPESTDTIAKSAFNNCVSWVWLYGYTGSAAETFKTGNVGYFIPVDRASFLTAELSSSGDSVSLNWTTSDYAVSYRLYRTEAPADYPLVLLTETTDTSYTDSDVTAGSRYNYYIYIVEDSGEELTCDRAIVSVPLQDTSAYREYTYNVNSDGESVTIVKYNGSDDMVAIPDTLDGKKVTVIGEGAFQDCITITHLKVPGTVEYIGKSAFEGCTSLEYAALADRETPNSGTTSYGYIAFKNCTALKHVYIGRNISSLGDDMFMNCTSLTRIYIPSTVSYMGGNIFNNCEYVGIYGYKGTKAHDYASRYSNVYFSAMDSMPVLTAERSENGDSAVISWTAKSNALRYILFRTETFFSGYKTLLTETDELSYTDTGLSDGTEYYYYLYPVLYEDIEDIEPYEYSILSLGSAHDDQSGDNISISGNITIPGGDTDNMTFELLDADGTVIASTESSDGSYSFEDVENGDYTLRVSKQNYVPRTYPVTVGDTPARIPVELRKYGDINGDGYTDAKDATQILRYDAGYEAMIGQNGVGTDAYLLAVADILGTGSPNAKDATQILRFEAGMTSKFDVLLK